MALLPIIYQSCYPHVDETTQHHANRWPTKFRSAPSGGKQVHPFNNMCIFFLSTYYICASTNEEKFWIRIWSIWCQFFQRGNAFLVGQRLVVAGPTINDKLFIYQYWSVEMRFISLLHCKKIVNLGMVVQKSNEDGVFFEISSMCLYPEWGVQVIRPRGRRKYAYCMYIHTPKLEKQKVMGSSSSSSSRSGQVGKSTWSIEEVWKEKKDDQISQRPNALLK